MDYSIIEDREIAIYAEICIKYLTKIYYNLAYDSAQIYIYDIIEFLKDEILSNPTGGELVKSNPHPTYLMVISPHDNFNSLIKQIRVLWEIDKTRHQIILDKFEIDFVEPSD